MKSFTIFWKVFGTIGMIVAAIVVFMFLYFPAKQIEDLEDAMDRKARSLGEVMSQQLAGTLDFNDEEGASEGLRALTGDPDVTYAVLFDGEGNVIASRGADADTISGLNSAWRKGAEVNLVGDMLQLKQSIATPSGTRGVLAMGLTRDAIILRSRSVRLTALGIGVVLLLFGVAIAFVVGRHIATGAQEIARIAENVADGDLAQPVAKWQSSDEIGRMALSFNRMLISQRDLVIQIKAGAESLSLASADLISTAQEQEQGAREQSTTVEEVSMSMLALSDTARAIAERADELAVASDQVSLNARDGQGALEAVGDAIEQIVQQNEVIATRMSSLYERSQAIISVVDIIDDISDRLDLLALNAALEGTRVGDAGKGFSLVAQEMRRLAENVSGSTKEIKTTIKEIHRYIQGSLDASREGTSTTRQGADEIGKMSGSIAKIFSLIETSADAARSITASAQQQLSSTEQIVAAMAEVASVSNQGISAAEGVTRSAADMTSLSEQLRERVKSFRVNAGDAPRA